MILENLRFKWLRGISRTGLLIGMLFLATFHLDAQLVVFDQGFESNTDEWYDVSLPYGTVTRVSSGTDGIPSSDGSWHAKLGEDATNETGPFTRFGVYQTVFSGGFTSYVDIYLDVNMPDGEGFDFSTAVNGQDGNHRRDFIWHVVKVAGLGLLVNEDNNSYGSPNAGVVQSANGGNYYTVPASGWYTFKTVFRDDADVLAVDFELYDPTGALVHTNTRSDASDVISTIVEGNRYGWFPFIDVTAEIHVDETSLEYVNDLPVHNVTQDIY